MQEIYQENTIKAIERERKWLEFPLNIEIKSAVKTFKFAKNLRPGKMMFQSAILLKIFSVEL